MEEKEKFALENPIQLITDKDRNDLTREDLIKVIHKKQIERITFHYTGIDGKLKELRIPVTSRRQIELILSEGERTDGSSLFKGMIDAGKSDLYVVPVYRTAFINPFDPTSLNIICRFLDSEGNLAEFAPDNILHKAAKNLRDKTGLSHQALGELEFYLIGHHENSTYPLAKQKGYHATAPFAKSTEIVNEMLKYMTQITGAIKYAHNEVGFIPHLESDFAELKGKSAEQVEIEFLLSDVEDTADIMVLAGWLVRNVAYRKGFVASFFPKIEVQQAGNGLHFHNALLRDGKNIMTNTNGELSPEAINLIGGLSHYATSLNAFGNMVSSSYLRLVPHQEAPTKVCWSQSNRSALIRVPLAWTNTNNLAMKLNPQQKDKLPADESRQTVELRSPDGSANVHMLLAGISMAAEWGLTNPKESTKLAEATYVKENIHSHPGLHNLAELPTSCVESAEVLLQHKNLYTRDGIFPENTIQYVAKSLQNENDRNLNKRLLSLPEDERTYESRRIMHRNIHRH